MNNLGAGMVGGDALGRSLHRSLSEDFRALIEDPALAPVEVTVSTPVADGIAVNVATGAITKTELVDVLPGSFGPLTTQEMARFDTEATDTALHLSRVTVRVPPTTESRVTISGDAYEVLSVVSQPGDLFYRLILRRRKGA